MIDLHYILSFNGQKIALMLEEVGLEYRVITYNVLEGEHLTAALHQLNPNHKLPVIVDHDPSDGGEPLPVFESGAILLYLAEKTGMLMPTDFRRREVARQWLIWQVAGMGPMVGQANHFVRYAPVGEEYGVRRYLAEVHRILSVLDTRLRDHEFLADEYSVADIACWSVAVTLTSIAVDLEPYAAVCRWRDAIDARPAVMRVTTDPQTALPRRVMQPRVTLRDDQWSNMFGAAMLAAPRSAVASTASAPGSRPRP